MHFPRSITHLPPSTEKLSSMKLVPGAKKLGTTALNWRRDPKPVEMQNVEWTQREAQSPGFLRGLQPQRSPLPRSEGVEKQETHRALQLLHQAKNKLVSDKVGRQSQSHPHTIRANWGADRAAWTWARWKASALVRTHRAMGLRAEWGWTEACGTKDKYTAAGMKKELKEKKAWAYQSLGQGRSRQRDLRERREWRRGEPARMCPPETVLKTQLGRLETLFLHAIQGSEPAPALGLILNPSRASQVAQW